MQVNKAEIANAVEFAENWNVSAIIFGDGESRLPSESYFGSTSSDGAIYGF